MRLTFQVFHDDQEEGVAIVRCLGGVVAYLFANLAAAQIGARIAALQHAYPYPILAYRSVA
jgi:hypothetical protein